MPEPADTARSNPPVATPPSVVKGGRAWRVLGCLGIIAIAMVILGELACWAVGLGDPPLYVTDPQIGYMMKPGVSHPLGHVVSINRWSQRGPDFPERKADPREVRVLIIGDSIVYGGAVLDDADLATSALEPALAQALNRPARVANIACGSWGPGNELAYVQRFGTFDADAAVLVFNSLDYGSVVRHEPLSWAQPTRKPVLALEEGVKRLILRFAPALAPAPSAVDEYNPTAEDAAGSLRALRELVELLRARGVQVAAVMHPRYSELTGTMLPGRARLVDALTQLNVPVTTTDAAMRRAQELGQSPYRDDIHLSLEGQRVLSGVLLDAARSVVPMAPSR